MTVHTPVSMSEDAFLAWLEGREGRYEYAGGRIVMLVHVTKRRSTNRPPAPGIDLPLADLYRGVD